MPAAVVSSVIAVSYSPVSVARVAAVAVYKAACPETAVSLSVIKAVADAFAVVTAVVAVVKFVVAVSRRVYMVASSVVCSV